MRTINLLIVCVVAMIAGCGPDVVGRVGVSGTVTYQGAPLKVGRIRFAPAEGNSGPAAGAEIDDEGYYEIPAVSGPGPGSYQITITSGPMPSKAALGKKHVNNPPPLFETPQEFKLVKNITVDRGELTLDLNLSAADLERAVVSD